MTTNEQNEIIGVAAGIAAELSHLAATLANCECALTKDPEKRAFVSRLHHICAAAANGMRSH